MTELTIIVPGTPVSVNMYVRHTRSGRHYVVKEANAFKRSVGFLLAGRSISADEYSLEVWVFLGHNQRGDGDNFWKIIADALVEAKAIHSDAAVIDWVLHKRRDRTNPRTEITIWDASEFDNRVTQAGCHKRSAARSKATNQRGISENVR